MSDVATKPTDSGAAPSAGVTKKYGFSALITGLARMWRGTAPALIVIAVNAIVQAVLIFWNAQVGLNAAFIISFIISFAVLLVSFAVLARTALAAVDGKVSLSGAISGTTAVLGNFVLWAVVLFVLVTIGFMIYPFVGLLVCWLLAFLAPAAADGQKNAIGANFRALKDRWGRWLITSILLSIGGVIMFLLMAVNVFFIHGFMASLIGWLVLGLVAWWLLTAWSAIYRSTKVGATADTSEAASA